MCADTLLVEQDDRGPDEDLKFWREAASHLNPEEQKVIRSVIESILLRSRRWAGNEAGVK